MALTLADELARSRFLRSTVGPLYRALKRARGRRALRRLGRRADRRIVVGSSGVAQPGWLATEIDFLDLLDPADWREIAEDSLDAILAEHVWEHLREEDAAVAAARCFRHLRPGGYLRLAVPDGCHPDPGYRRAVEPGGTGLGADDHKVLYTYETLSKLLAAAGFEVELLEYFDENGAFHYREWDPRDGLIHRSKRFDERNSDGSLRYTSIVVDARKPVSPPGRPKARLEV